MSDIDARDLEPEHECPHGYSVDCPDCDAPAYLPAVLTPLYPDTDSAGVERLYGMADMARALGVTPNALSNRSARGIARTLQLPAPAYVYGSRERPLWRASDIQAVAAMRISQIQADIDALTGNKGE